MKAPFEFLGFDHCRFIVGNAKQAAYYYQSVFGFELVACQGLETGERETASYVLGQKKIRFVLDTPYHGQSVLNDSLRAHGDGVCDIAFAVDDAEAAWKFTTERGARSVREPSTVTDEHGTIVSAAVRTYGDTIHTFVERKNYSGVFWPGYEMAESALRTEPVGVKVIDHIVGNQPDGQMEKIADFYRDVFGFHRLWTVDDDDIQTDYSSLRSIVVADDREIIKMPINEPAPGKKKSQIQEYVDYYDGAGVQHIAMLTGDVVSTVGKLRQNGVEFLPTPMTYYEELEGRVGKIDEDVDVLADLGILVDRDDDGYLLQIFTKPVQDRPTLFYEIIQRKGARSFGKGNFKALFESIEREQERRGNL
ncbi:MAG: 4-hydroxyphenylpyruvate dioxygenase [Candidatus Latescibacterota bacterium]|nr:MAG: 4-hydroxyphenylpyruvate dioxygenase [Candidatus Latescibacterota bacterium]